MIGHSSPYVGLVPYSEADAELFFGREREQRIIAANLRASRLTLLYGASGVGKTSVLLAGVLPELRRAVAANRRSAVEVRNGRGSIALADRAPMAVAVFRDWRDPPLPRVADAIRASVIEACGDDDVDGWAPGAPLVDTLRGYTARVRTLLVVLDQFEEYFLYHPEDDSPGSFDHALAAVANDVDLRVHFMLSLREDALSQLDRFKGRIPGLFANYLRVDYLDRESARRAVTEPVAAYNRGLGEGAPRSTVADDLIEEVLDAVRAGRLAFGEGQAAAQSDGAPPIEVHVDRVETPYLQLVMERLWEAAAQPDGSHVLTRRTLEDLGGAEAIVSSHLTEAMSSLSADDEDLAATVFQFLVTPSKTKIAHRASDLAFWAKRPPADVARVLDQLAGERRIVRSLPPPPGEDEGRYEIFHDVLAEAVLEWCGGHNAERERAALAEKLREEDRARRKARRDRILRRLAVVLAVVIVGLLGLLAYALDQRSKSRAEERRARSVGIAAAASGQIPIDPERAILLAREALAVDDTRAAREALVSAVAASHVVARMGHRTTPRPCGSACRPGPAAASWSPPAAALTASSFSGQLQQASFARDGRTIATVTNGEVRIWQPETGRVRVVPGIANADAARIAPNGRSVLILDTSGRAHVASLTGEEVWRVPGRAQSVALSPDGRLVAATSFGGAVTVRRVGQRDPLPSKSPPAVAQQLEFSPVDSQQLLVSTYQNASLWRWRTSPPKRLVGSPTPPLPPAPAGAAPAPAVAVAPVPAAVPGGVAAVAWNSARFSPDGRAVVVIDIQGRTRVVDIAPVRRHRRISSGVASLAMISPRGKRVLTVEGRTATLRDTRTGYVLSTLAGHAGTINSAAFSPDGRFVATGSGDGTARVWEAETGNQTLELRGHGAAVTEVAFSPDGQRLLTDGEDGTTRVWDVYAGDIADVGLYTKVLAAPRRDGSVAMLDAWNGIVHVWTPGRPPQRMGGYGINIETGAISPDGEQIAMTGYRPGRGLVIRNLGSGEAKVLSRRLVDVLGFSPDGSKLFTLTEYGRPEHAVARVWDTASGERLPLAEPRFPAESFTGVVWGPENRVLVFSDTGPVRIVDAETGRTLVPFTRHSVGPGGLSAARGGGFSPDGKLVVTAGPRQALVWRTATGAVTGHLQGHSAPLTVAAFSPDGRWILTGDQDGTIRIWDWRRERSVADLPSHGSAVVSVGFTASGRILSTAEDGTVRLYPCLPCRPPEEIRSLADQRVTRDLTSAERRAYLGESG